MREDRKDGKSRVFEAELLAYLAAPELWQLGAARTIRPAWIAYLTSEGAARAFTSNFRRGLKATADLQTYEIPRTAGHRWLTTRVRAGDVEAVVTTAYLPELFHLEPTFPDRPGARFLFAPPRWWLAAQAEELAEDFGDDAAGAAAGALFAAYLDRRTHLPLVNDLRFHLQLYRAAQEEPWLSRLGEDPDLFGDGLEAVGFDDVLAVDVGARDLNRFIRRQTAIFHQQEIQNGTHRIPADRRLLPDPGHAPEQLCFDFALA
ncbi:MAG: hypothetical protein D6696_00555 [Acidobacteria bacterium]|nr:MAG: hypothetical protein D6696_00555 [Acidobacteriota bacterium]